MPCEDQIDLGHRGVFVLLTHIVGDPLFREPIVVALLLEVWIRDWGPDSVIHT